MAWHQRGAVAAAFGLLACCALVGLVLKDRTSETALAQGIVAPGMQVYEVPQDRRHRQQLSFSSKAQVAMGNVGGSDGRWPIPPPPPPTWTRGGNTWVYDGIYGNGQRPTTGIWGEGKFPPSSPAAEPPAPAPSVEVVEEVTQPDGTKKDIIVPATEIAPPAPAAAPVFEIPQPQPQPAAAPVQAPIIEQPFAAPLVAAPAPAPPMVEEIIKPNGKTEEIIVPAPPAPAPMPVAAPAAPAPAPAVEEECKGPNGPCTQVYVSAPVPTVMTSYIQSPPVAVPVPAPASAQLPMEWAAEDAAEHAYNLAQWRVKILRAKNDQAVLRKKLMELSMGTEVSSSRRSRGRTAGTTKELKDIKVSLLDLAKNTVDAIKDLKTQMEKLRKEQCCTKSAKTAAQTSELSQLPGAITDKEKRELMVLQLKKKMDDQLDGLLKKVSTLIQKGKKH